MGGNVRTSTLFGLATIATLVAIGSTASHASIATPTKQICTELYQQAYENSYDTLEIVEALGKTELCFADLNDTVTAETPVPLDDVRDRFGALCTLLADATPTPTLSRIHNLQCRVEAERGLSTLIESYLAGRGLMTETVAVWDEFNDDKPLARLQELSALDASLDAASTQVVEHFIASIQAAHPERDIAEIKTQVVNTLAIQKPESICEDLSKLTPEGSVCTSDVLALTSGLIYRYADLK